MIGFDSSLNLFGIEEYGARSGNEWKLVYKIYFTFRLYSSIGIITRSLNKEGEMWDIYIHIYTLYPCWYI